MGLKFRNLTSSGSILLHQNECDGYKKALKDLRERRKLVIFDQKIHQIDLSIFLNNYIHGFSLCSFESSWTRARSRRTVHAQCYCWANDCTIPLKILLNTNERGFNIEYRPPTNSFARNHPCDRRHFMSNRTLKNVSRARVNSLDRQPAQGKPHCSAARPRTHAHLAAERRILIRELLADAGARPGDEHHFAAEGVAGMRRDCMGISHICIDDFSGQSFSYSFVTRGSQFCALLRAMQFPFICPPTPVFGVAWLPDLRSILLSGSISFANSKISWSASGLPRITVLHISQ